MMRRYWELDAIRGIAALIVVFHHCIGALIERWTMPMLTGVGLMNPESIQQSALWFLMTPLRLLIAGPSAVSLFFVLSGFVLTLPMLGQHEFSYREYLIKRFFRLYIPFAAAVLLAALLCSLVEVGPLPEFTEWLSGDWRQPMSWHLVVGHLLIPGVPRFQSLDSPIWSLVHEMRISVIFPVLAAMVMIRPRMVLLGGFVGYAALAAINKYGVANIVMPLLRDIVVSIIESARFVLFFAVGAALAAHLEVVRAVFTRLSPITRMGLWLLCAVLLSVPDYQVPRPFFYFGSLFGAVILLMLCLTSVQAQSVLNHAAARWLGRVSYSLYLLHLIVILALAHSLNGQLPSWLLMVVAVVVSLLVAEVACRYIEMPSQSLGRRVAARFARRNVRDAAPSEALVTDAVSDKRQPLSA